MASNQRTVKGPTVLAWWDRITEKVAQNPADMQLRGLENALYFVCRRNGAKLTRGKTVARPAEGEPVDSGGAPPPAGFDWEHGEMVFDVLQPDGLVAELERVTGIPEHSHGQPGARR
jgi:hypothetical protein